MEKILKLADSKTLLLVLTFLNLISMMVAYSVGDAVLPLGNGLASFVTAYVYWETE